MKINKETNVKLEFTESESSFFLASAMYDYICEVDKELKDNIGFDENENTNNNDFLYAYIGDDLETKSRIVHYIIQILK